MDLGTFREQFPQYDDLSDEQLADSLYNRFYSDLPREQFNELVGLPEPGQPLLIDPGTRPQTRLADGGVSIALRGPSVEEIQDRTLGIPDVSFSEGATRAFGRRLLDNLLATPEVLADALTRTVAPRRSDLSPAGLPGPIEAIAGGVNLLTGGAVDPAASGERVRERIAQGQSVIDVPSGAEVTAGTDVALQLPSAVLAGQPLQIGERFEQALERQQVSDIRAREEAPIGTVTGEIGGDIATIAALRAGGRGAATGTALPRAQTAAAPAAQTAQSVLGRIVQSTGRSLRRSGGRALETGAEGALLASLQEADPATVGSLAAGGQLIGDLSRPTFKKFANPVTLMAAVGTASLVSLGIQQWTPGGLDRILPTLEAKNKEAFMALLLTGSAAAITGRPGTNLTGSGAINELANIVPRGTLVSVIKEAVKDPRIAPVLAKFAEDPDFFGPKAKRLLTRAQTVEGASVGATVDSLMDDRSFRQQFRSLSATASGT